MNVKLCLIFTLSLNVVQGVCLENDCMTMAFDIFFFLILFNDMVRVYSVLGMKTVWMCLSQCEEQISQSLAVAQALADDVDFHVFAFRDFGKGKVKKCRVSPDAFIQMALQLAYYRVSLNHVNSFIISSPLCRWKGSKVSYSTKNVWSFTAKQHCSILLNK